MDRNWPGRIRLGCSGQKIESRDQAKPSRRVKGTKTSQNPNVRVSSISRPGSGAGPARARPKSRTKAGLLDLAAFFHNAPLFHKVDLLHCAPLFHKAALFSKAALFHKAAPEHMHPTHLL